MNDPDNSLEKLLQQVDVPDDLKCQLKQITSQPIAPIPDNNLDESPELKTEPSRPIQETPIGPQKSQTRIWAGLLVAAALIGILLSINPFGQPFASSTRRAKAPTHENEIAENDTAPDRSDENEDPLPDSLTNKLADSTPEGFPTDSADDREQIRMLELKLEISRLNRKIAAIQREALQFPAPRPIDAESIIACYTTQARKEWGDDESDIDAELRSVIERFPESAGAKYANALLSSPRL